MADEKLKELQAVQSEIQQLYGQKQQSLSQLNENTLVKGELDLMANDAHIYKMVGQILVSVDLEEAKENVGKRLEFITKEIEKVESLLVTKEKEQKELEAELSALQQDMRIQAAAATEQVIGK